MRSAQGKRVRQMADLAHGTIRYQHFHDVEAEFDRRIFRQL
jgi:hypothetical protein